MMLFAEAAGSLPAGPVIGVGMGALAFLVWLVKQQSEIKKYIRDAAGVKETSRTKVANQPLRVTPEPEYLEKAAMGLIKEMIASVTNEHQAGDNRLEKRIDDLSRQIEKNRDAAVADAKERTENLDTRIDKLEKRIDGTPERVVLLLKQTKGLIN